MPTIDLTEGRQTLSCYNVVGQRAEGQTRFVIHVGLLDEDSQSVEAGGEVSAVHMRPPLKQGEAIKVHVAGHVPLTNDEIKEVSAWIEEIKDEYQESGVGKRCQYIIDPPWKDEYDPDTGVRRYRRYSCAGFVLDAHRQVGIELLKIDEGTLPDVYPQAIKSAYPDAIRYSGRLRRYGLEGGGPWKVVLAGYILHALNRPTGQIRREPYQAKCGDEQF
jgi:hypothetical protein